MLVKFWTFIKIVLLTFQFVFVSMLTVHSQKSRCLWWSTSDEGVGKIMSYAIGKGSRAKIVKWLLAWLEILGENL